MRDDAAREDTRRRLAKREKQFGKKSSQQSDPTRDSPQTVAPPRHDDARAMSRSTDTLSVIQYNVLADALSGPDAGVHVDAAVRSRVRRATREAPRKDNRRRRGRRVPSGGRSLPRRVQARDGRRGVRRNLPRGRVEPVQEAVGGDAPGRGSRFFYKREKLQLCGMDLPGVPRRSKDVDDDKSLLGKCIDAGKCIVARFRVLPPREETHGPRWEEYQNSTLEVVVATVHLDSKKDEEGAKKRRNQAFHMMQAVEKMRSNSPTNFFLPVIVAGDFNAVPSEPAVDRVRNGV